MNHLAVDYDARGAHDTITHDVPQFSTFSSLTATPLAFATWSISAMVFLQLVQPVPSTLISMMRSLS
jgi:hypothetical protein